MDLTPSGRIVRAEALVREQRRSEWPLSPIPSGELDGGGDYVLIDQAEEYRDDLHQLQAAVLGEDVR